MLLHPVTGRCQLVAPQLVARECGRVPACLGPDRTQRRAKNSRGLAPAWQGFHRKGHGMRIVMAASPESSTEEVVYAREGPHRTLLFSVDGTKDAEEGLRWVVKYLARKGDTIQLAHVLSDPRTPFSGLSRTSIAGTWTETAEEKAYMDRLERDAQGMLSTRFAPIVRGAGLEGHTSLLRLRTGKSAAAIGELVADAAVRLGASLLLIPSHGPGIMADYGSVARWCQDHSRVPVMLLPPSVLHGTDGHPLDPGTDAGGSVIVAGPAGSSDLDRLHKAFVFAARRIAQQGDSLRVINIVAGPPDEGALAQERETLKNAVAQWAQDIPSERQLKVTTDVMRDEAMVFDEGGSRVGAALCDLARDTTARTVVLLRHGDDLASQLQFAPLTVHAIKHCTRPLIVLEPERNLAPIAPPVDVVEVEEREHRRPAPAVYPSGPPTGGQGADDIGDIEEELGTVP